MTYLSIVAGIPLVSNQANGLLSPNGQSFTLRLLYSQVAPPKPSVYEVVTGDATSWVAAQDSELVAVVSDLAGLTADLGWRSRQPQPVSPGPSLDDLKAARIVRVDASTDVLIAKGFVVSDKTFSASNEAQLKWLGMFVSAAVLTYPVTVPTIDDKALATLVNADDVGTYYQALLARVQTVLTGGVELKLQIMEAATADELNTIVDSRT